MVSIESIHPAMRAGVGAVIGYGIILTILLVVVFLLPYGLFRLL